MFIVTEYAALNETRKATKTHVPRFAKLLRNL